MSKDAFVGGIWGLYSSKICGLKITSANQNQRHDRICEKNNRVWDKRDFRIIWSIKDIFWWFLWFSWND